MARTRFHPVAPAVLQTAPPEARKRCEALRAQASRRKLLLLDCGIMRHAPFAEDGSSIWELLPTCEWFEATGNLNLHQAIDLLEHIADGPGDHEDIQKVHGCFGNAEYYAEADCFGYDEASVSGSGVRYGIADWLGAIEHSAAEYEYANLIDYYLITYDGQYYSWGSYSPLHSDHQKVAVQLIEDIFGNPFRPATIAPDVLAWHDETVVKLARRIYDDRRWDLMPILADALEDAGCDNPDLPAHCRGPGPHVRGCWVVDLLLGKT